MISFVWRTDVHVSDTPPSSRLDDWNTTILDKLGQVRDLAVLNRASAILDGGDFFHVKSPTKNSHETVRRVIDHHRGYPFPVLCTPGNHDSVYGDHNFLGQQPLGVLFSSGVFLRCYDEHEFYFGPPYIQGVATMYPFTRGGGWVRGNPFSAPRNPGEPIVRVVGIPYHGPHYDMSRFSSLVKGEEDYLLATAHVLASEKGGKMFEGEDIVRYADLLDMAPDVWCFGHWHKDQGVVKLGDKTFVNVGSLTRGSLSQDEVQRRPASVVLRFSPEGLETETVRLRVKPAEEVFDVEGRQLQVERQVEIDGFVEKVRDVLQSQPQLALSEVVSAAEFPERVRQRAAAYLEKA